MLKITAALNFVIGFIVSIQISINTHSFFVSFTIGMALTLLTTAAIVAVIKMGNEIAELRSTQWEILNRLNKLSHLMTEEKKSERKKPIFTDFTEQSKEQQRGKVCTNCFEPSRADGGTCSACGYPLIG